MRLTIVGRSEPDALATGLARGAAQADLPVAHVPAPPPLVRFRRLRHLRRFQLDWFWLTPHVIALSHRVRASRPEAVVCVKALGFRPPLVRLFRRLVGVPVWNLYPDIPGDPADAPFRVVESLKAFDGVLIWSPHLVEELRRAGLRRVELLRFACDTATYYPPPDGVAPEIDVSFVGTWHPEREAVVRALGPITYGVVAGPNWSRASALPAGWTRRSERIAPEEARNIYWRSKVVLNVLHPLSKPGYNMRSFEVPACGAAMLATRTDEHAELFQDGREAVLYRSPAEAAAHAATLLSDDDRRLDIERAALRRVATETYEARARELVDRIR